MDRLLGNTAIGGGYYGKRNFQTGYCGPFSRPSVV